MHAPLIYPPVAVPIDADPYELQDTLDDLGESEHLLRHAIKSISVSVSPYETKGIFVDLSRHFLQPFPNVFELALTDFCHLVALEDDEDDWEPLPLFASRLRSLTLSPVRGGPYSAWLLHADLEQMPHLAELGLYGMLFEPDDDPLHWPRLRYALRGYTYCLYGYEDTSPVTHNGDRYDDATLTPGGWTRPCTCCRGGTVPPYLCIALSRRRDVDELLSPGVDLSTVCKLSIQLPQDEPSPERRAIGTSSDLNSLSITLADYVPLVARCPRLRDFRIVAKSPAPVPISELLSPLVAVSGPLRQLDIHLRTIRLAEGNTMLATVDRTLVGALEFPALRRLRQLYLFFPRETYDEDPNDKLPRLTKLCLQRRIRFKWFVKD